MLYRTLQEEDLPALHTAFNLAFENYFVPMQMDFSHFCQYFIDVRQIDLNTSGVLTADDGSITAFAMHAMSKRPNGVTAYNAGTGVIPEYRGQRLGVQLYEKTLNELQARGVKTIVLEVVKQNQAALSAYRRVGFLCTRELDLYQQDNETMVRSELIASRIDWRCGLPREGFEDTAPAWPCDPRNIGPANNLISGFAVLDNGRLEGYTLANTRTGRISYLAVRAESRRRGIGTTLLSTVAAESGKTLSFSNVPSTAKGLRAFLQDRGFSSTFTQYEMKLSR